MSNRKYYTQDERPNKKEFQEDYTNAENLVETAGYISPEQQIRNLIDAGERLNAFRDEMYDYNNDYIITGDEEVDPTRSGNYDLADAFQDSLKVNQRLKKQAEEAKKNADVNNVVSKDVKTNSNSSKDSNSDKLDSGKDSSVDK